MQSVTDAVSVSQTLKKVEALKPTPKPVEQSTDTAPPSLPPPAPTLPTAATPASSAPASSVELDLPVAAIAGGLFAAFAAGTFLMRGRDEDASPSPAPSSAGGSVGSTTDDVSIPYDAAARIAYDDWRAANNKGAFDASKFNKFNANYMKVTSANMGAKKIARDTGSSPEMQTLGPDADQ